MPTDSPLPRPILGGLVFLASAGLATIAATLLVFTDIFRRAAPGHGGRRERGLALLNP